MEKQLLTKTVSRAAFSKAKEKPVLNKAARRAIALRRRALTRFLKTKKAEDKST